MTDQAAPSADQIRTAVVAAARLTREDPLHVYDFRAGVHARHLAYAALREVFEDSQHISAFSLGYFGTKEANRQLASARRASWWNDEWVVEVVGAVVSDRYGAQAQ